jgi:hypothetical protein
MPFVDSSGSDVHLWAASSRRVGNVAGFVNEMHAMGMRNHDAPVCVLTLINPEDIRVAAAARAMQIGCLFVNIN